VRGPSRRVLGGAAIAGLLALAACSPPPEAPADGELGGALAVYAAASLAGTFDRIADRFTDEHPGVQIVRVYDGSSTLATQIIEGAPADVFAPADEATLRRVDPDVEPVVFATNTLVIAVPADNPADVASLADLLGATVVLCAPEVPCGAASAALLDRAGVELTPASVEQSVTAVLTKVAAGDAEAGLVYATDVRGVDGVRAIVPEHAAEVVNRYPIAVLPGGRNRAAAEAFVAFIRSGEGRRVLTDSGFGTP
jgi:molybdate transport system substrate-binding protein